MNNYRGKYIYHFYNGNWSNSKYMIKTIVFAILLSSLIVIRSLGTVMFNFLPALPICLILFTVLLIWYIKHNNNFSLAAISVLVQDGKQLWYISMKATYDQDATNTAVSLPYFEQAKLNAQNKLYIDNFIDNVKDGKIVWNLFYGGNKYSILENYHIVKENKNFYYVEALVTTRKMTLKKKVIKIAKTYDNIKAVLEDPKPYEPFGFSDGRD